MKNRVSAVDGTAVEVARGFEFEGKGGGFKGLVLTLHREEAVEDDAVLGVVEGLWGEARLLAEVEGLGVDEDGGDDPFLGLDGMRERSTVVVGFDWAGGLEGFDVHGRASPDGFIERTVALWRSTPCPARKLWTYRWKSSNEWWDFRHPMKT
jgi:hypothetical protein